MQNASIWEQYPARTPGQWGAAANAADAEEEWINPDWTELQINSYWFGFYERQKVVLQHAERYWINEIHRAKEAQ